jgi:superfamily II DNA or RNA helicase
VAADLMLRFERGTLVIDGPWADELPGVLWDPRSSSRRAAAHRFGALVAEASLRGAGVTGDLRDRWAPAPRSARDLGLRSYQSQALAAWSAFDRRGVIVLPTGAGKTRVAIAAILNAGVPSAVLCPTRALAAAWKAELERWAGAPIGLVGDGHHVVERITVLTFESAYRHMDSLGDRFGLLVVDEVHHFGGGVRAEALEASAAIARLGLTATAPPRSSEASAAIDELVGPVVFEMGFADLVGTHLADVTLTRIAVRLEPDEREAYERGVRRYDELARAFRRAYPGGDYASLVRTIAGTSDGRRALRDNAQALELAAFPRAKRRLVGELLSRHESDKSIVFTAYAENAYRLALDNLVPVITGETGVRERQYILDQFSKGALRTIASARVLNEGIDVPDARVAIIVAGSQGKREHVQRIGRVLRPAPGKHALVYELVTAETSDARRAHTRGKNAPGSSAQFPSTRG